jgi:RNA polymerase sigma-70 factor, ECF subfamily
VTDGSTSSHSPAVLTATADLTTGDLGAEASTGLALDTVYREHFDFVWRIARRLGVATSALDDVVQDVFLVVHRRLDGFEGRSTVKTWLYGITRRVVSEHRRRHRRRPETPLDERGPEPIEASAQRPDERAERAEAVALLHRLLDGLPDDQREVFVLAELEQLSAPEIVELTGAKLNTVYSRLRLARRAFERALRRERSPERGGT